MCFTFLSVLFSLFQFELPVIDICSQVATGGYCWVRWPSSALILLGSVVASISYPLRWQPWVRRQWPSSALIQLSSVLASIRASSQVATGGYCWVRWPSFALILFSWVVSLLRSVYDLSSACFFLSAGSYSSFVFFFVFLFCFLNLCEFIGQVVSQ